MGKKEHRRNVMLPTQNTLPVPVCSNGSCIDEPLLFITVEEQVPFSS
jgi:hypothetical protein